MATYMARQRKNTVTKTTRLIASINDALQDYANEQLISENAAINQLLKQILVQKGYVIDTNETNPDD